MIGSLETSRAILAGASDAADFKARLIAAFPELPASFIIDGYSPLLFPG